MIKRSLWILATAVILSACSSGVKLNDVPVEDKNASASTSADATAVPSAAQSSVAPVVSGKAEAQGVAPAGVNVIYFDYDSFTLLPEARAVLERNAAHLQANKQFKVQLEGHTDERPSFAPNSKLIVYATVLQGREALMTSTLDGKIKARLAGQSGDIREPAWGPYR